MKATKRITRLCSILLAVVIVMAMSVSSAFAAQLGTGEGSITITNATVGKSYTIYKIFDTDSTGVGSTATEAQKDFYESQSGNPFKFTQNAAGTYNVSIATKPDTEETYTNQEVIAFLQSFVTKNEETGVITVNQQFANVVDASTPETAKNATVTFDNIPYGYYLVTSSLGAVVTVNSTDPDVEVIDKNQKPGGGDEPFTKTVNGEDKVVEIGTPFTYTLTFDATNYDGETKITHYTITDTLPAGMELSYDEETANGTYGVNVKVGESEVTLPANSITYTLGENATHILKINIPWTYTEESGDHKVGDFIYSSPASVEVTYSAVLTDDAAIQQNIENKATLTWDGDSTGTSTEETVQTYAMAIMKVDEQGNPLSGAEFAVTKQVSSPTEENPDATISQKVNVSQVMDEEGNPVAGVYVVDPDSKSNTVVSPNSGLIVIKGVDNVTYTLTETKAPNGYNLLDEPETVTPVSNGSTTITIYKDENGNVTEQVTENKTDITSPVKVTAKIVENKAGSELPSTGGMGTTVIYIVGGVLVAGAAVLLVTRRRMHA